MKEKTAKPLTTCTVESLLKHINAIVTGKPSAWYVMIDEHNMTIELINPVTLEMHGISASNIYYRKE